VQDIRQYDEPGRHLPSGLALFPSPRGCRWDAGLISQGLLSLGFGSSFYCFFYFSFFFFSFFFDLLPFFFGFRGVI